MSNDDDELVSTSLENKVPGSRVVSTNDIREGTSSEAAGEGRG